MKAVKSNKERGCMIPKTIHYCWFGGNPLPDEARSYIEDWRRLCPDYQIIEWNEGNFDVSCVSYVKEAYDSRKWAFVTDYVRLYALYHQGGIYLDTDVEMIKPIDEFLVEEAFSGFERENAVPTGIMGSVPGQRAVKDLLDEYKDRHFLNENGDMDMSTNVEAITRYFIDNGLVLNGKKQTINGFTMYPTEYFCPKDSRTLEVSATEKTYTIHHFAGTWVGDKTRARKLVKKLLGPKLCGMIVSVMDKVGIK